MDIIATRQDQYLHAITVRGDIDSCTAGEFLLRLRALIEPGSGLILLDLSQVPFMNRAGLRALDALEQVVRATGGSVQIAALSPGVARLFELAATPGGSLRHLTPPDLAAEPQAAAPDEGSTTWADTAV